jgi:hypothetical protein
LAVRVSLLGNAAEKLTLHEPELSVHELGVRVPVPPVEKFTVPVGAAPPAASATVAVQDTLEPAAGLAGVHESDVVLTRSPLLKSARKSASRLTVTQVPPNVTNDPPEYGALPPARCDEPALSM